MSGLTEDERLRPPGDHVQALMRGLRILEHVHRAAAPVAVREVAQALGLNVSTTHHLVNTLVWEGYLVRSGDRRLAPGDRPGCAAPADESPPAVRRALGRTAYAADDVAVLSCLDGGEAYISDSAGVPGATSAGRYPTGTRDLAHLLATGRVLLAWQPEDEAEATLERTRRLARERREIFDLHALREDLARIREQRYDTLVGEAHGCVAAPVLAADGRCVAAVAVVVAPQRIRRERERLVSLGQWAGRALSTAMQDSANAVRGAP